MFDTALFLGIPVDEKLNAELENVNPHVRALFIKNDSDYLHQASHQGQEFIGKQLGKLQEMNQFTLLESNIYSLLKKLVPDYPCTEQPLLLFPQQLSTPD